MVTTVVTVGVVVLVSVTFVVASVVVAVVEWVVVSPELLLSSVIPHAVNSESVSTIAAVIAINFLIIFSPFKNKGGDYAAF